MENAAKTRQEGVAVQKLEASHKKLTHEQMGQLTKWKDFQNEVNLDTLLKKSKGTIKEHGTGSYTDVRKSIVKTNLYLEFDEMIPSWAWECLGFFLIGLAFFKWGITSGKRSNLFYLGMVVIGYGIGIPLRIYLFSKALEYKFDPSFMSEVIPFNIYQIPRLAMTCGHIGLFVLGYKSGFFKGFFKALSNVGQMAFTNYLSQSIICTLIFYGYGLGLFGQLERHQTYEVVAAVWVFQLIFSAVWLRFFLFGPLEWLWRSLTYWQRQPMLRG
jgi:uncharacterized protein